MPLAYPVQSGFPETLVYAAVELDNRHPVPVSWDSADTATGAARVLIDPATATLLYMEMTAEGLYADAANAAGSANLLDGFNGAGAFVQPFHFHNQPQGGPDFFVQQLFDTDPAAPDPTAPVTALLENTAGGFRFETAGYALRDPVNDPALDAGFVVDTIRQNDGTAYLGLHSAAEPIPQTAIAGDVVVLFDGALDGALHLGGAAGEIAIGTGRGDLFSMGGGHDHVFGLRGDDVIDGGSGDDSLFGNAGDDTLWGGDGHDALRGGAGDDVLMGNRGDDRLVGGTGADLLQGGLGDDLLTGGWEEADTFVIAAADEGADIITDFALCGPQADTLRLTLAGEDHVLAGAADLLDFVAHLAEGGMAETGAILSGHALTLVLGAGGSVRLDGVASPWGLDPLALLLAGAELEAGLYA